MKMRGDSVVEKKSFELSLAIVELYKHYKSESAFRPLFLQLLRSGTSIGANIQEAIGGQSRKDFVSKLSIARKESYETKYWIELLNESGIISSEKSRKTKELNLEVLKILTAIKKSCENNSSRLNTQ
jgi:four helix bundle protein